MMTESKIELIVEKEMDKLDRKLLDGRISQREYDREVERLDRWADNQLDKIR